MNQTIRGMGLPDPDAVFPNEYGTSCYIKNVVTAPNIQIGDYTYYDDPVDPAGFEQNNVLFNYPEFGDRLIIGKFCSIAAGTQFIMGPANHRTSSVSTYPFQVFGGAWADQAPPHLGQLPRKGDIMVGNDVWIGRESVILPGVHIGDGAIIAAATLSNRYITDRFLPDKAIDLVDEACAMIRTEMDSMPTELDIIQRKIIQHEIEEAALKKETDKISQEHLAEIQKELSDMREEFNAKKAQWDNEKNAIGKVQKLREELEAANAQLEKAQREYDLNKAAELQYGKIPELKKALEAEEQIASEGRQRSLLRDKVTEEEIARIIERWTGIPVARLMEGEREKLLHLEDILHQRVVGQDEAVRLVSEAILRSRAGIADPNKPIGSFLFLGPTGVGKTELAKTLAEALFDSEKNLVRIDMSEYMEKFSVSRLIGAPPGYVGYEEGGQLTEAVRRKPYSVILFDEVEKAHPDVFNILLQVLDDGRITDSQGRTVDFKNTIIILTSNLGSQFLLDGIGADGEISQEARNQVNELLKRSFRPEFLNRLDEIVFYKPLTKDNVTHIIDLMVADINRRLSDKQLTVELTPAAKDFIIDSAYDPIYGARPLRRYLQHTVETLISRKIIADQVESGQRLTVDYRDGELVVDGREVLSGEVITLS